MGNRHWAQGVTAHAHGAGAGQGLPLEPGGSGHPDLADRDLTRVPRDDGLTQPQKVNPGGYTSWFFPVPISPLVRWQ